MSRVLVKIGDEWWTVAPGVASREVSAALTIGFGQVNATTLRGGPDWEAQQAWDMGQKGVTIPFSLRREFASPFDLATWLASILAGTGETSQVWQADIIIRWEHEDSEGWTESMLPWGVLRIGAMQLEGDTVLRVTCQLMGPELVDFALRSRAVLATEDGRPFVTEAGWPLVVETYRTVEAA
jgi:hypothetical protein